MSYYEIIEGRRYDRQLLDLARSSGILSLPRIKQIWNQALDGGRLTEIEKKTLRYIRENFPLAAEAIDWLDQQVVEPDPDRVIQKVIEAYDLNGISLELAPEELGDELEEILVSALDALLNRGINQLSLPSFALRALPEVAENSALLLELEKYWIREEGRLILLGSKEADFEYPLFPLQPEIFWNFGFESESLPYVRILIRVLRNGLEGHSLGYFSRMPATEDLAEIIIRQYLDFESLRWELNGEAPGDALFSALHTGLFNGESSQSFRDLIQTEIWPNPNKTIQSFQKDYADSGVLYLLPHPEFPIPEYWTPDFTNQLNFGLRMDSFTDIRVFITTNREGDLDSSWNDSFFFQGMEDFAARTHKVLSIEFDLEGLSVFVDEAEYINQTQQYGPDWIPFHALFRQALNTYLQDFLTPASLFNLTREVHGISPEEVENQIRSYLQTGRLYFLPLEIGEDDPVLRAPTDGESGELFWRFLLYLPDLSDHAFFCLIHRYPDDEGRPYCYSFN